MFNGDENFNEYNEYFDFVRRMMIDDLDLKLDNIMDIEFEEIKSNHKKNGILGKWKFLCNIKNREARFPQSSNNHLIYETMGFYAWQVYKVRDEKLKKLGI